MLEVAFSDTNDDSSGQTGVIVAYSHEHHCGIVIILQKSALSILLSHNITGGESII